MSGVPVICTDQGGFTETVKHGVSGLRCHTLADFKAATERMDWDRQAIRARAIRKYSMDAVRPAYEAYLNRLQTIWTPRGWAHLDG